MNMKMVLDSKSKCCGCGACSLLCPVGAIQMKRDKEGFLYPIIDERICIHCQKCLSACPSLKSRTPAEVQRVFAGRHQNANIVKKSRSGGAFTLLSDLIIQQNGVVYGVIYDDHSHSAHYTRADSKSKRDKMRGSKYVEADLKNAYCMVKSDLQHDKVVLFSGTPCHVAGLKAYLSDMDYKNLYTIDILCNSVCSPLILDKYLRVLNKFFRKPIKKFCFRDKSRRGWSSAEESFYVGSSKIYLHFYNTLYESHMFNKPSCYQCPYRSKDREGDLSIGDAWGLQTDNKGFSIILCNTAKGYALFRKVLEGNLFCGSEISPKDYAHMQNAGWSPYEYCIDQRKQAWKHFHKYGFLYTLFVDFERKRFTAHVRQKRKQS